MVIIDSIFYYTVFCGEKIPQENIEKELMLASYDIDSFINYKDQKLTPYQEERVKMAICQKAEENYNALDTGEFAGLSSFSLGDMSISLKDTDSEKAGGLTPAVKRFLMPTNLLNRCI